jgi:hypothetical protein
MPRALAIICCSPFMEVVQMLMPPAKAEFGKRLRLSLTLDNPDHPILHVFRGHSCAALLVNLPSMYTEGLLVRTFFDEETFSCRQLPLHDLTHAYELVAKLAAEDKNLLRRKFMDMAGGTA